MERSSDVLGGECVCCVFFSFGGMLEMDWRMGEEGCGEFVGECW